jgi:putative hydrolase of the HAD superfamily
MLGYISHEQFIGKYLKNHKLDLSVAEFDELFKKDIVPTEGMIPLFQKLSQNFKIALATNEGKILTKYKVEGSLLMGYLSKVIPSYLLKEIKPTINFFKKTLKIIDVKPSECLFIDDAKINCDAATSLGIESIQFKDLKQLEKKLVELQIL